MKATIGDQSVLKQGVTVSGGHPVPITTPASGTAFDIVGQNIASAEGLKQAFLLCTRMGEVRRQKTPLK
ncbi:MAG: 4-hydroxythreonine-4-phosphate dehydrogenase PdxA [Rhodospirillales bacterium]|jgi:4-hydroxythreonine-4-phosphate dehydrogenase